VGLFHFVPCVLFAMPDLTKYPDANELVSFLLAAGMAVDAPPCGPVYLAAINALGSAVAEWEERTCWQPFLSSGQDSARVFDGPGAEILDLDGGLLSLTSLTISGTAYTQNQQFTLGPQDAAARGRPFTYLDFGLPAYSQGGGYGLLSGGFLGFVPMGRRSIAVVGQWGRCNALPGDARQAVLTRAAEMLYPQRVAAMTGVVSQTQTADGTSIKFRGGEFNPFSGDKGGAVSFAAVVERYRRLAM